MASRPSTRWIPSLALAAALLFGCETTLREMPTAAEMESLAQAASQEYEIGERDVLQITVWRQPELSLGGVEVRLDGKISFPLLDDVQAAGLTPLELKQVIAERLQEYVSEPNVTVVLSASRSKQIYMLGQIGREGALLLQPKMRIVDAIAMAGGLGAFSGKSAIKLIRTNPDGATVEFRFDYDAFIDGENLEQNVLLLPGDRIVVPEESPFWR